MINRPTKGQFYGPLRLFKVQKANKINKIRYRQELQSFPSLLSFGVVKKTLDIIITVIAKNGYHNHDDDGK